MDDFDEFERWFEKNRREDVDAAVRDAQDEFQARPGCAGDTPENMRELLRCEMRAEFRTTLRAYHEWVSSRP